METKVLESIKKCKEVSISYIQRECMLGFCRAGKVFNELVEEGFIDKEGNPNKTKIYEALGETYIEPIKLIFLSVDGVLNSHSTKEKIEDSKVKLLKEIVKESKAEIVIISSWKDNWYKEGKLKSKQDNLANLLDEKLATYNLFIKDKTIDSDPSKRGEGILAYIDSLKHSGVEVDKYVILDDEMFDYLETKLTKHLVQTSFNNDGLERKHVRKALEKLC